MSWHADYLLADRHGPRHAIPSFLRARHIATRRFISRSKLKSFLSSLLAHRRADGAPITATSPPRLTLTSPSRRLSASLEAIHWLHPRHYFAGVHTLKKQRAISRRKILLFARKHDLAKHEMSIICAAGQMMKRYYHYHFISAARHMQYTSRSP